MQDCSSIPFDDDANDVIPLNSCSPPEFKDLPPEKFNPTYYLRHIAPKLDNFLSSLESREQQVYGHIEPDAEKKQIHPHQRVRNVPKAYPEVYEKLKDFQPSSPDLTFEELYKEIESIIRPIPHIGNLAIYDITLRIGWKLPKPIKPSRYVYLHQGAKMGAQLLFGKEIKPPYIPLSEIEELVKPLTEAHHIEDYLCHYHINNNKTKQ